MSTDAENNVTSYPVLRLIFVPVLGLILAGAMESGSLAEPEPNVVINLNSIDIDDPGPPLKGDLYVYLDRVADRESSGRARIVNQYGYLGKYQFSPKTLWNLGRQFKVTRQEFLGNITLQDSAMVQYLRENREMLRDIIVEYGGKWYNGIYVTESGILAGAHLVGPSGVLAFFDPEYEICYSANRCRRPRTVDGNGTPVSEYLDRFSRYDLSGLD